MIPERHASRRLITVAGAFALAALSARPARGDLTLAYSTYLGGTGDEAYEAFNGIVSIAVDGSGNRYVTGATSSADFPTTTGAAFGGDVDIFVTKFSPSGAVVYSTYLGGPCADVSRGIAVDAAGNAYVTGRANGGVCWADVKAGVLVAKLDPTGAVVYSSIFGGRLVDTSIGHAIAVDGEGHAYVTGAATSDTRDFPTTEGALRTAACDNVYEFGGDGFVAKLSVDGSTFVYSTLLCGRGDDSPSGIAVDAAGNAYVAGITASTDFPIVNAFQESFRGGPVAITGFVSKLAPDGSHLVYSTYLGGSENDAISGLAIDGGGNAYVTGETLSTDFPTTTGVLQPSAGNRFCPWQCTDAFVAKLAASGSSLVYSTYLFGELSEGGSAIAVDGAGNAYVVGTTNSLSFPIRGAFQTLPRGTDAFVTKLDPAGFRIVYSSLLGGSNSGSSPRTGWDQATGIAIDATGHAYVAGYTQSYDFPTTPGAYQPAIGNGVCDVFGTPCGDAFVTEIAPDGPRAALPVSLDVAPAEVGRGGTLTAAWAGIAMPSADDHLRLYTLGSKEDYPGVIAAWWPTTGADGALALTFPDTLAPGWYDLRLYSDDATYHLPTMVARSEPILVGDGPGITGGGPGAAACAGATCDDGDVCTVDSCVPGTGCVSTPAAVASVACTCRRSAPDACVGAALPAAIARRRERACGFFDGAGGASRPQRKRLRKGMATLGGSIGAVTKARRKGKISSACAGALEAELHDAMDRAQRVLSTLGSPRR